MKLKSIKIKSYRSCIKTNFEIQRDLTALIGSNSSGKSNILSAILLLKRISYFLRNEFRRETDSYLSKSIIEVEVEYKSKPVIFHSKISYTTDEKNNDDILSAETNWDFSKLFPKYKNIQIPQFMLSYQNALFDEYSSTSRLIRIPAEFEFEKNEPMREILPHVINILKGFNKISYYGASQFSDPSQCPNFIEIEEDRPVKRYRSSERHQRFIIDLYQAFKNKDKKKYDLYINTVNKFGIGLIDNIAFQEVKIPSSSYKVLSGGKFRTFTRNRQLIIPNITIDGNILSPNQLSEGTFRTLAMLFYLLTDENDILLVEEPEVCVHHGLLNSIISLIKSQSKKKQIIISTHSDYLLDHLMPENLILTTRLPGKGTSAKPLTQAMSKNEYRGLKKYLEEFGNLGDYWKESGF